MDFIIDRLRSGDSRIYPPAYKRCPDAFKKLKLTPD